MSTQGGPSGLAQIIAALGATGPTHSVRPASIPSSEVFGHPTVGATGALSVTLDPVIASATGMVRPVSADGELLLGMQVIEHRDKVADGELIRAVSVPWQRLANELARDPSLLFRFDWRKMEELVAAAYHDDGNFDVTLTPRAGDRGRDVIAVSKEGYTIRILDQVKKLAPNHVVTADDVRAMYGVLTLDQAASKAYITTTSTYAPGIQAEFAKFIPTRLQLRDGADVIAWFAHLARKTDPK